MTSSKSLRIPIANSSECVEIFPDELPHDIDDILDVLRAEFAPLKIWRSVAVEYYRQGQRSNFEKVLTEIASDPEAEEYYVKKGEYKDGIVEILDALAAYSLYCSQNVDDPSSEIDRGKEIEQYIKKAEIVNPLNEYTWLIKAFYELAYGTLKNAEYWLKSAHEAANKPGNKDKRVYLYGSLLGLGCVAFTNKKYSSALNYFTKALHHNSKCGSNVWVAIATCTFRLEQFDETRAALDRALAANPANVDALVMLALLERMESQKADKKRKAECREIAYDLCLLAAEIDPTCSMALNHMANHCFYTWRPLSKQAEVISTNQIRVTTNSYVDSLRVRDVLQIRKAFITTVESIVKSDDDQLEGASYADITLETEMPHEWIGQSCLVESKGFSKINEVKNHATKALRSTNVPGIRAESLYILGRLYHMLREFNLAFRLYEEALKIQPDMSLAAFGMGQLYIAREDFSNALEKFGEVLRAYPDDRDTQAYTILLKSIHLKESTSFDKLREVAPGFAFEADLWLSQGHTMQLKGPGEYPTALKCYEMALDCMNKQGLVPHSHVLLNMGVLYHSLGKLSVANDYMRRSLQQNAGSDTDSSKPLNPLFRRPENDIFYSWSQELCEATSERCDESSPLGCVMRFHHSTNDNSDLSETFHVDDDILAGEVLLTVTEVHADFIKCRCSFPFPAGRTCTLRKKIPGNNFNMDTISNCFNLARIQEDFGYYHAAREIYVELSKMHPAFLECYIRLSLMAKEIGRLDEALYWISKALQCDPESADANVVHGDLLGLMEKWEPAKKKYETICRQRHHDARSLLSLGNLYFSNISTKKSFLKDSFKFYHLVLREDPRNVFAANGLGMVCAAQEQNDIAREIFSRAREAHMPMTHEISLNLGHMHMIQGKLVDATYIYHSVLKSILVSPAVQSQCHNFVAVSECLALSHFKNEQYDDTVRVLLKALYRDPSQTHNWFNIACAKEEYAVKLCRQHKSVADISHAIDELEQAIGLFRALKQPALLSASSKESKYKPSKAEDHEKFCLENIDKARVYMSRAQSEENKALELRAKQQEEHNLRQAQRQKERAEELERQQRAREEQQEKARQKHKEFERLKESWTATESKTSGAAGEKKTKKKKKGKQNKGDDDLPTDDFVDDDLGYLESDSGDKKSNATVAGQDSINDILGSSDDDDDYSSSDNKRAKETTNPDEEKELFDSDSEGEMDIADMQSKPKLMVSGGIKRSERSSDDGDEELEFEVGDSNGERAATTAPPFKQRRIMDDDDEEE
mmetsp:Transcript_24965/g.36827  ORF Transcript_24965/g.36827 Transcript_24965/m.36827 type:complete len:1271 (-) Transcript_24965:188-4000(-)|eukprot:CAMPEP_0185030960 /NCGR_PEP_ID=MMETSP1103-20130426/18129_1 /TAXON_ID=36769 /ORGANISM="Paraphysomonas bandaiensis, Strain Caron Lab Isolate" /LENGTH=1270 /DNA_ID=CAMNT_0027566277 /DNA_START=38 /DNA_END=3850 /DNA_ORIENTATION=+